MKEKKKIICLFMSFLCILMITFSFAFVRTKAEGNNEELVIGVPVDRCPVFYLEKGTGKVTGIGVDLMTIAAENAGYTVKFTQIKEATIKDALDNSAYDVIMPFGSAVKSTQGKTTVVSDNLFETPFTLVSNGNVNLPALNELHVGMVSSLAGAGDTVKQMYPGINITLYSTMDESVNSLRAGKVDALLHNSYVWSYVLQKPSYGDLKMLPSEMFSMDFKAGVVDTEKGRGIITRLNEGIAKITDTQRQAITLDYTSRKLYQYDFSDYVYRYGVYVLLITLLILALIVIAIIWNHSLRMKHAKKLKMLVDQDQLTGVYSLEGFRKKAEELIANHLEVPYLLIYANIKNFKYINETLGKSAGDDILCYLANSVKISLSEVETVGRINADRFVILYRNNGRTRTLYDYEKEFDPVRNYFIDKGKDNRVLLCYGIYVLTKEDYHDINVDRMIDCAHLAEKKLREKQNEGYEFYNHEQWEKVEKTAEIINCLPAAIKNGTIEVWYQPQMNYEKEILIGAEALCRWEHEKQGFLYPNSFIPILEENGMIYELDCYVWERVCQDLRKWKDLGYHQFVSVNVSRWDIKEDNDLSEVFINLIKKYELEPEQLRIEITESAYVESPEILIKTTEKLRSLGFQVEMDDFGSGYSSLNMLKEVPVDRVKLDLRFLTTTGDLEKSRIITKCMIQMLKQLKIEALAEGVETKEQAEYLLKQGCAAMQGFYFYNALKVEEFSRLFMEDKKKNK